MGKHFECLVDAVLADADRPIDQLNLLPEEERQLLIYGFNRTGADYPHQATLVSLFENQVERTPRAIAVVCADRQLDYRELNRQANRLAHALRERPGMVAAMIGVLMDKSERAIITLLGILKAGAAYLPLDPTYPPERIRAMVSEAGCRLILTESQYLDLAGACQPEEAIPVLTAPESPDGEASNPAPTAGPKDPAYLICTSGSTGRPKACVISHRNVVRLMKNSRFRFKFGPRDVWLQAHSLCFDFSVWEMYGALLYGGKLVVLPAHEVRDPVLFRPQLRRHRVTVLNQTPAAFSTSSSWNTARSTTWTNSAV